VPGTDDGVGRIRDRPVPLERRIETKQRLSRTREIEVPSTAKLIYDAMVKVADRTTESNKLLESKANGVIALSSALLGFGATSRTHIMFRTGRSRRWRSCRFCSRWAAAFALRW
jgi:hypothetical protein